MGLINWKVKGTPGENTTSPGFESFEKQGSMPLERARIEAQRMIAEQIAENNELLKTQNSILVEQNEYLRDMDALFAKHFEMYLTKQNEHLAANGMLHATIEKIHKELENIVISKNGPQQ